MQISTSPFGTLPDGRQVLLYTLENNSGMRADILNFGGVVYRLLVPDRDGSPGDVVLGHPCLDDYRGNPGYYGALIGRNSNRIAGASVVIGGTEYALDKNDGANNLHGGGGCLAYRLMAGEVRTAGVQPALQLSTTMEEGSDGFPGNLTITVVYTVTDDNTLRIDYRAVADRDTVINLTNHSYFNLAGHTAGAVYDHTLQLDASFYTPADAQCLPTGEIRHVEGSPMDFRNPRTIGEGLREQCPQLIQFGGYDHNLILNGRGYRTVGCVTEPSSGRKMEIATDLPAVQLYTGNGIAKDSPGKDGATYGPHGGFCLETQFIPNAVHMPWLAQPVFAAGVEFLSTTSYRFSTV